jgi:hypothetical protein
MKQIIWKTISVDITKIKPTPNNFKLKTEDGTARFKKSVEKYGLAGAVILNSDFTLIDGNTRWEEAKEKKMKKIDASMPDRKLTLKEFSEFSAMYDMARAGEVDVLRIKEELGTTDSFFKDWGFDLPKQALAKLAELEMNEAVVNPTGARKIADNAKEIPTSRITLLFTKDEAAEYIILAEALYSKFKVDNVTDLSLAVLRFLKTAATGSKKSLNGKAK